jgi:ATP-dependent helicase/nuclease subunit A
MSRNPRASARQLAASDPGASAWVSANAGSGKTKVLVDRVIRLMLAGADPARIMCLTFTKAAAAEMANRLFERLSLWVTQPAAEIEVALDELGMAGGDAGLQRRARQLFTRALETPGGLRIQTIHAFCERVLQAFPVEAGIVPRFTVLDERSARDLLLEARGAVLDDALKHGESVLGRAVAEVVKRVQPDGFDDLMTQLLSRRAELQEILTQDHGIDRIMAALRAQCGLPDALTAADVVAALALDRDRYLDIATALARGSKQDANSLARLGPGLDREPASLIDLKDFYLTTAGEPRSKIATNGVLGQLPWLADFIAAEQQRLIVALERLSDLERLGATRALLVLAGAVMRRFEEAKRRRGAYDFDDLIIRTASLLGDRADAQWVLYKLDGGMDHLLVDEAQDTSPAQWKIIAALTEEFFAGAGRPTPRPRTVFAVGDRKQSIYSFQGADPDVFAQVQAEFAARLDAAGSRLADVDFTVSFRSTPQVLQAVDTVFAPGRTARQGLDGANSRDWLHESNRRAAQGLVEIWPLIEPLDRSDEEPWTAPVDREPAQSPRRRLAAHVAGRIASWIGRRRNVATGLAVMPGDILVLVQKRNVLFEALIRELRKRGVPVAGADRLKLSETLAVQDLMALASFSLMPEDDHALACVLKSPILARPLGEDQLMAIAIGRGRLTLWEALRASTDPSCRAAAAELALVLATAPTARPYEFFAGLLVNARMRLLSRLGSEANDALDALLGEALSYEEDHPATLAGFVNWFAADESEIKRNMEQAAGEVRIMTVHGAKGLEAPIVILADAPVAPDARQQPPLIMAELEGAPLRLPFWPVPKLRDSATVRAWKQRASLLQSEEYRRLLYVAMTRARDELYVCGCVGQQAPKPDNWYELIEEALASLKPALRQLPEGGWRLGPDPEWGPDGSRGALAAEAIPAWVSAPAPRMADRPGRSVTGLIGETAPADADRSAAASRGTVIHRMLQLLPDVPADQRAGLAQRIAERAGFAAQLAQSVLALLDQPDMAEIFGAGGLSEVPLVVDLPGIAGPVTGRIDRLVVTSDRIIAIDYKTGRRVPEGKDDLDPAHVQQMAAYRAALRRIHPGAAIVLGLLYTEAPKLLFLDDDVLDRGADQFGVMRP